nr:hypothetical protein [Tanacetum cinerariifolium]
MEEYIKLQAEKGQRRGRMFNWKTATYGKSYCDDLDFFTDIKANYLAIVYNDVVTSNENVPSKPPAPKKVTVTDLFYLRGIDVDSVNIHYLLARYLRRFASGRKRVALISRVQFVARMAKHFGLFTKERLQGLTAWVALGPEKQPDVATSALEVAEGALDIDEGAQVILAPVQESQPPQAAAQGRTMPERLARLEEEVYGLRGSVGEQRDVLDNMARDFSRTDDANTLAPHQLDP